MSVTPDQIDGVYAALDRYAQRVSVTGDPANAQPAAVRQILDALGMTAQGQEKP